MKKAITATLMSSAILLSGCSTQVANFKPTSNLQPTYEKSQAFFIGGIGQENTVDAAKICGGAENIAKVESSWSGSDILVGILTIAIYTPRTAKVYCQ